MADVGHTDDSLDPCAENPGGALAADCTIHMAIDADQDMADAVTDAAADHDRAAAVAAAADHVVADHGIAAPAVHGSRSLAWAEEDQEPVHLDSEVVEHQSWGIQVVKAAKRYVQVGHIRQVGGWYSSELRGE